MASYDAASNDLSPLHRPRSYWVRAWSPRRTLLFIIFSSTALWTGTFLLAYLIG